MFPNRYRRGLETCPQAKASKSGHAFFFSFSDASERRVENTRVHFWTFSPVSVKCFQKMKNHKYIVSYLSKKLTSRLLFHIPTSKIRHLLFLGLSIRVCHKRCWFFHHWRNQLALIIQNQPALYGLAELTFHSKATI